MENTAQPENNSAQNPAPTSTPQQSSASQIASSYVLPKSNDIVSNTISYLIMGIITIVLILVTLGILNYIGVIPVSKMIPFLSFLPSQAIPVQSDNSTTQNVIPKQEFNPIVTPGEFSTTTIINPTDKVVVENTGSEYTYTPVENAFTKVNGKFRMDFDMSATIPPGENVSGVSISNAAEATQDYRAIEIFRYVPDNNWLLAFVNGESKEYFYISKSTNSEKEYERFTIVISDDGKSAQIAASDGESKTVSFPTSLYDLINQLTVGIFAAPNSQIELYSLNYTEYN